MNSIELLCCDICFVYFFILQLCKSEILCVVNLSSKYGCVLLACICICAPAIQNKYIKNRCSPNYNLEFDVIYFLTVTPLYLAKGI